MRTSDFISIILTVALSFYGSYLLQHNTLGVHPLLVFLLILVLIVLLFYFVRGIRKILSEMIPYRLVKSSRNNGKYVLKINKRGVNYSWVLSEVSTGEVIAGTGNHGEPNEYSKEDTYLKGQQKFGRKIKVVHEVSEDIENGDKFWHIYFN